MELIKYAESYLQKVGTELEKQLLCEQYEEVNGKWVIVIRPMCDDDIVFAYMQYINNNL